MTCPKCDQPGHPVDRDPATGEVLVLGCSTPGCANCDPVVPTKMIGALLPPDLDVLTDPPALRAYMRHVAKRAGLGELVGEVKVEIKRDYRTDESIARVTCRALEIQP